MKFGCCVSISNILKAKEFGYDFVELSAKEIMEISDNDWMTKKTEILGLKIPVIGLNSFCDERNPIVGPNVDLARLTQYLDLVIKRATDLNCKNIGIGAPAARILPESFSYELATNQMKYFLRTAASKASKYKINILFEAINPNECNFGNSTLEIYNFIQELNLPNLKIIWDVFHSVNANEKYKDLTKIFNKVEHVHACSWNKDLHRQYLLEKDQQYLNELAIFLVSQNYNKTISVEAFDNNFDKIGFISVKMFNKTQKYIFVNCNGKSSTF